MWSVHYLTNPLSQNMARTLASDLPIEMKVFYGILPPIVYILTPVSLIDSTADIITNEYHYLPKKIYRSLTNR